MTDFASIMAVISKAFDISYDQATVDVWYSSLKDIPIDVLKAGSKRMIAQYEGRPKIATLRRFCGSEVEIPSESEIMEDLRKAVLDYGVYENPEFKHKITHAIVEELGWKAVCDTPEIDLPDKIHWRYTAVAEEFRSCQITGKEFRLSEIKGIFALNEGKVEETKQIGKLLGEMKEDRRLE